MRALLLALALAATPAQYLQAAQGPDGCWSGGAQLTAWAALGLRAAGSDPGRALSCLAGHERELASATDVELAVVAEAALGEASPALLARLRGLVRASGQIGPALNSTIWGVLALRQAGEAAPPASVRFLLARQARSGGWSWAAGIAPDSNDTAAALEALAAAGVRGRSMARGVAYLRRLENPDGGFELTPGRESDAQSTAWAIQGFLAAGARPPRQAYAYLARLRRPDGSYRYSASYATAPVWVTAQVLPALAGKPFPLR